MNHTVKPNGGTKDAPGPADAGTFCQRRRLQSKRAEERIMVNGCLNSILAGFAISLIIGAFLLAALFLRYIRLELDIPIIFTASTLLQFMGLGGIVGAAIYFSGIALDCPDASQARQGGDAPDAETYSVKCYR